MVAKHTSKRNVVIHNNKMISLYKHTYTSLPPDNEEQEKLKKFYSNFMT